MNLVISIELDEKKGRHKGKYIVNIKEEGKGSSGGFLMYFGVYDSVVFDNKLWKAAAEELK
uniref:Uncharacterized protein n=1 Tax=viral metagenome TaxID=1070528 RepID=A0A6M3LD31_9ZZZZ